MALTTGMAILGSAALGAGASALSSNSAAKKAANASQQATDANAELQREALATQQSNTAVARGAGDASVQQLMQRLSIQQNAGQGAASGSSPAPSGFNDAAYLAANPDVAAAVQRGETTAAQHYAQYGQSEGRPLGTPAPVPAASTPAPTNDVQLSPATQVPTYERPADPAPGTPGGQPTYTAPTYERPEFNQTLDVSMDRFKNSPEYQAAQYEIEKQGGQVQASLAAQGLLNSGAALRRLQQVGQDNSVRYYGDFRDYNTGQYNTDRSRFDSNYNFDTSLASNNALAYANLGQNAYQYGQTRADNNFNVDRGYGTDLALNNRQYETGRYDNQTNALFNLANLGQGAASQYGSAVQNTANNQGNALFSNAANQGNAALTSANNLNSLLGQGANALAYYYGNKG